MHRQEISRMIVTEGGKDFCEVERRQDVTNQNQKMVETRNLTLPDNSYPIYNNEMQENLKTVTQTSFCRFTNKDGKMKIPKAVHTNNKFILPLLDKTDISKLTKSQGNFVARKIADSHKIVEDYERVTKGGSFQDQFRFVSPDKIRNKYSRLSNFGVTTSTFYGKNGIDINYDAISDHLSQRFNKMLYMENNIDRLVQKHKCVSDDIGKNIKNCKNKAKNNHRVYLDKILSAPETQEEINERNGINKILDGVKPQVRKCGVKAQLVHNKKYANLWKEMRDFTLSVRKKKVINASKQCYGKEDVKFMDQYNKYYQHN